MPSKQLPIGEPPSCKEEEGICDLKSHYCHKLFTKIYAAGCNQHNIGICYDFNKTTFVGACKDQLSVPQIKCLMQQPNCPKLSKCL